ncbi:MAG: dienelactone hydrolase family protein [Alphaproteobacteria bacterium]
MGERTTLTTADGFDLPAWHEQPGDARRGGLVICHAIWGVTPHLRELAGQYAEDGFEVLVPNLFARQGQEFAEQNFDPNLMEQQNARAVATGWGDTTLPDVQAAIDALKSPVFVMGFCFGGTVAWLTACRATGVAAAACFYGGQIHLFAEETPKCPTILHFGKTDPLIPPAEVELITSKHPDIPAFHYDAGHAFVAPNGYHADSARLARLRTLQLFARQGGRGEA